MNIIWILPHRSQDDDEAVIVNGVSCRLSDALDVSTLPPAVTLGIPESVLRKHGTNDLIFSQFVRDAPSVRSYYILSVPAGKDKGGRAVYLTALTVLEAGEHIPSLLPTDELDGPERDLAKTLQQRLQDVQDHWAARVQEMIKAVRHNPNVVSFANVLIPRSPYPSRWTPEKKTFGRIALATLCAVIGVATIMVLRNCSQNGDVRPAERNAVTQRSK